MIINIGENLNRLRLIKNSLNNLQRFSECHLKR